jgi:hypothetical protein
MKNQNGQHRTKIAVFVTAVALACLSSSMVKADDENETEGAAIVGLWHDHFTSSVGGPAFDTYAEWHGDGLEIETPSFANAVCMGTFKSVAAGTFKLFHVGWTPGGIPPAPTAVRFELRELNTVSLDHNSFNGTYDQKFFDANGNLVFEDKGKIHSTRLTADMF